MKIIIEESVKVEDFVKNLNNGGVKISYWRGKGSKSDILNFTNGGKEIVKDKWIGKGTVIR